MREQNRPARYYSQQLDAVATGMPPRLRAISALTLPSKAIEEMLGNPVLPFVPPSLEILLNSHHTQHYSVNQLASYKALLLSSPNVNILL